MVIVLLLLCTVSTTRASFIRTPKSVNTTLGSTATFTCSASRGSITWFVNGSTLPELNTPDINNMNAGIMSTLIIPAKAKYNNTNVTCSINIRAEGLFLDSDVVVLRVQGTPAALSNLTSTNLAVEQVIRLTWDAPPTLDIAAVDPDISYCVDIRVNINDKDSFPLTTVCNVYIPQFNFTMDYPNTSTSVIYEFRVTPRNGAGEGPKSAPVYGFFSGPPAGIVADMVEVSVSVNLLDVDLIVSFVGGVPPGEIPNQLQVHAFTIDDDQNSAHCSVTAPFTLNSNEMVFIHLNKSTCGSGLVHHRRYKAIVITKNDLGTKNSTGEIHFSTHEIRTVRANSSSRPGVVNIICTFAENSRAMGYLSILHPKASSSQEMFVVANRHDAVSAALNISVPGVPPGNYVVIVFHLESSGLPVLSTVTNPYVRSAGESDVAVLEPGEDVDGFHVDGSLIEIPDPAMTTEQQLCIFFESSTSSDQIVVLAHHTEDPTKLSAYSSRGNQCFEAPTAGNYSFAVFIQNGDSTLEPPATSPEILIRTVSTSSAIPAPSTTTPTIMTDPETFPLGAIIGIIVAVLAIAGVCVVIAAVMYIIVKKRMCKYILILQHTNTGRAHGSTNNQRENEGHPKSLELSSYKHTEKGEDEPQRITADSEMEQTNGLVYADVNTLPGKTKPPSRDDRVQYSNIIPQPVVIASTLIVLAAMFSAELNMKGRKYKTQDFGGSDEELNLDFEQLVEKGENEPVKIAEVLHFSRELNPEREELVLKAIGLLVIKYLLPFSTGQASSA